MGRRWIIATVPAVFAAALWLPAEWVDRLPLCLFRQFSGWDCPGCGLTRAFVAMFHGHWMKAIQFNALAPAVALYLALYAADGGYALKTGRRPQWASPAGTRWITYLFGVLTFGQWFYKSGLHLYHSYLY